MRSRRNPPGYGMRDRVLVHNSRFFLCPPGSFIPLYHKGYVKETVTADLNNIIDATLDAQIAVLIDGCRIASEVDTGYCLPTGPVAIRITIGTTLLTSLLPDQAALHRVLGTLRRLNLGLLSSLSRQ